MVGLLKEWTKAGHPATDGCDDMRTQATFDETHFPQEDLIGIGAAVTRRPLPHHRAYGSVHGGSSWLR